jgi:hypothetical protein
MLYTSHISKIEGGAGSKSIRNLVEERLGEKV